MSQRPDEFAEQEPEPDLRHGRLRRAAGPAGSARGAPGGRARRVGQQVAEAAATLTGGHLDVVLHATRAATLPVNELAAIREHTRAPLILLASNGSPAFLEEALEHDVADVLLLPQLTDNVVFSIRKAGHVGKRLTGDAAPARPARDRLLAQGRHRQDRHRDEPRRLARQALGQANAAARPRPPVRRRGDHARDRAGEDDLRPRRRSGRARLGEARRLHDQATPPGSTSCPRRCARRTPSSSRRRSSPGCSRSRASRTT